LEEDADMARRDCAGGGVAAALGERGEADHVEDEATTRFRHVARRPSGSAADGGRRISSPFDVRPTLGGVEEVYRITNQDGEAGEPLTT
jgi:hypothetical protein